MQITEANWDKEDPAAAEAVAPTLRICIERGYFKTPEALQLAEYLAEFLEDGPSDG